MLPLIRFVAVFGGVAAGAQVATHCVRAVKEVCRGRPVAALVEVADGLAAPILTAVNEVSKCGHEIYLAVTEPWTEKANEGPVEQAVTPRTMPCRQHLRAEEEGSANGVLSMAAKS
jgi:hypothetical protein